MRSSGFNASKIQGLIFNREEKMRPTKLGGIGGAGLALWLISAAGYADGDPVRGRYLSDVIGCDHCHTPGYFMGAPDENRYMHGGDVGFEIPGLGIFFGPNLTNSDKNGVGRYTTAQLKTMLTTGVRPDGSVLAPIMPWRSLSKMNDRDLSDLVAFLQSLPAADNQVAGPFLGDTPSTAPYMTIKMP